jgi:hypothetical protein
MLFQFSNSQRVEKVGMGVSSLDFCKDFIFVTSHTEHTLYSCLWYGKVWVHCWYCYVLWTKLFPYFIKVTRTRFFLFYVDVSSLLLYEGLALYVEKFTQILKTLVSSVCFNWHCNSTPHQLTYELHWCLLLSPRGDILSKYDFHLFSIDTKRQTSEQKMSWLEQLCENVSFLLLTGLVWSTLSESISIQRRLNCSLIRQ